MAEGVGVTVSSLPNLRSLVWVRRAAPVVATMCFELFDVGSDVYAYINVVEPSETLATSFKHGYLAWTCVSVAASLVALLWYARSLFLGYIDYVHNVHSSVSIVSNDAINVVAIKSRLQVSMLLALCEDTPSVLLNGFVLFGHAAQGVCVCHSLPVLISFAFSWLSLGYKLAAYQTFIQFRRVITEWEQRRGVIDVLQAAFERSVDAQSGAVSLRAREPHHTGGHELLAPAKAPAPAADERLELGAAEWRGVVTDSVLQVGALSNPRLVRLDVRSLRAIGDGAWEALELNCPQLRELRARGFALVADGHGCGAPLAVDSPESVTDAVVSLACAMCPALEQLDLAECALTDDGVALLCARAPQLASLSLAFAPHVTDRSARALAEGCRRLRTLNLRCTRVSEEASAQLRAARFETALELESPSDWVLQLLEWADVAPPRSRGAACGAAAGFGAGAAGEAAVAVDAGGVCVARVRGLTRAPVDAASSGATLPAWQLSDEHVRGLAMRKAELYALDLSRCARLTRAAAGWLARLPQLRRLSLRGCSGLALADVRAAVLGCAPLLEELELAGTWQSACKQTDARDVRAIVEACPRLRLLGCSQTCLSDECAQVLALAAGDALAVVHAHGCEHLTRVGAGSLAHHLPDCRLVLDFEVVDVLRGLWPNGRAPGASSPAES